MMSISTAPVALREKYAHALDESQRIRAKYDGDRYNDMTAEEAATWKKWLDESDTLRAQIDLYDRQTRSKAAAGVLEPMIKLAGAGAGAASVADEYGDDDDDDDFTIRPMTKGQQRAWRGYFRGKEIKSKGEVKALKALAAQEGDLGGFLVVPQALAMQIITLVKDLLYIRALATVYPLDKAESLGVPVLDTDLSDPTWTSELGTGVADSTAPFGKRSLSPHPLAKRILISNKLLRQASIDPEAIVMDRIAYKVARTEENAFLNGTGANQPLGVMVASANGISTARDFALASSTVIAGDDLIGARYTLKAPYWERAQWIFHRTLIMAIRKLKDSAGNYIWQPGLGGYVASGTSLINSLPETILGNRFMVSELMPNTQTTGLYVGIFGDFSRYWIADALDMQIQRLVELYAETNQTGFIIRKETDGMPVLEEAFVRLKQA
jgi:HK97 family phage major capsid protein